MSDTENHLQSSLNTACLGPTSAFGAVRDNLDRIGCSIGCLRCGDLLGRRFRLPDGNTRQSEGQCDGAQNRDHTDGLTHDWLFSLTTNFLEYYVFFMANSRREYNALVRKLEQTRRPRFGVGRIVGFAEPVRGVPFRSRSGPSQADNVTPVKQGSFDLLFVDSLATAATSSLIRPSFSSSCRTGFVP
jgi:hypothetical protein